MCLFCSLLFLFFALCFAGFAFAAKCNCFSCVPSINNTIFLESFALAVSFTLASVIVFVVGAL